MMAARIVSVTTYLKQGPVHLHLSVLRRQVTNTYAQLHNSIAVFGVNTKKWVIEEYPHTCFGKPHKLDCG
jgi:hypothetical protein